MMYERIGSTVFWHPFNQGAIIINFNPRRWSVYCYLGLWCEWQFGPIGYCCCEGGG